MSNIPPRDREKTIDIPTGEDVTVADVPVAQISYPRATADPLVVRYGGPIIEVIHGPRQQTSGSRETVLCAWYDYHRIGGRRHDAVAIESGCIRPGDAKTTVPTHRDRDRDGAFILRAPQHSLLQTVPESLRWDHGFESGGDYLLGVYSKLGDKDIILDDCLISADELERHAGVTFYDRGARTNHEASVEWGDVPGLSADEMTARLDAADTYLEALGEDPDKYRDSIKEVRALVREGASDDTSDETVEEAAAN